MKMRPSRTMGPLHRAAANGDVSGLRPSAVARMGGNVRHLPANFGVAFSRTQDRSSATAEGVRAVLRAAPHSTRTDRGRTETWKDYRRADDGCPRRAGDGPSRARRSLDETAAGLRALFRFHS